MDIVLIVVVALGFSGVIGLRSMAAFDHLWIWGLLDVAFAGLVLGTPARLKAVRPLVPLMAWLCLYFVDGYFLGDRTDLAAGAAQTALLVLLPLIMMTGVVLRDRRQWNRLAVALQIVAIGACAVSVAQTVSPGVLDYTTLSDAAYATVGLEFSRNRIPALWMNPNEAAFCFFFTFAISLWCRIPWLAWAGRCASVAGTLLTVSRGGWLIMAAFTVAYAVATPLMSLRQGRMKLSVVLRRVGSVAGIATALWCLAIILPLQRQDLLASVSERTMAYDRFSNDDLQRNVDDRYVAATYWLSKAMTGPWYGQGLLSFQRADGSINQGPHNQFIMVYGEVGFVGLLTYLMVLGLGFRRAWVMPMVDRDRLILVLMWCVFLFWHFKGHAMFNTREYVVVWGVLFIAPYALRRVRPFTASRPARPLPILIPSTNADVDG